jgi:beta-galactosidase
MDRAATRAALIAFCLIAGTAAAPQPRDTESPRRVGFDEGWRFQKGDTAGAERVDFNDDEWRRLDLPHDWAIEGPFDEKFGPPRGALPFYGVAWYRKHFVLAPAAGRFYSVEFDGAMSNARVFLNGHELGARPYGYIGFSFDLTPHLRAGSEGNVLVSRRGTLSPRVARQHWSGSRCALGHVRHDAASVGREGDGSHPHRDTEPE